MKKFLSLILAAILCLSSVAVLSSCGGDTDNASGGKTLKVGVVQYLSHPSLDNCYAGIEKALTSADVDIEIDRQIGSATSADSDCLTFAKNMVAKNYDMIIAIATPAAKAAYAATDGTDIPVIFCAVSDPVEAEIVASLDVPGEACTGTSDILDLEAQVDLIEALQPDVKSIGIIYTASEDNSVSNLARFKEICLERSIEVVAKSVNSPTEIPAVAADVAADVDCINNFTDNNVVNSLQVVLSAAEQNGIPVYGSEISQVSRGCLAAVSIDYIALGVTTGEMAAEVLSGADAAKMAVRTISEATPVINTDVLASLNMELPDAYASVETVTTEK